MSNIIILLSLFYSFEKKIASCPTDPNLNEIFFESQINKCLVNSADSIQIICIKKDVSYNNTSSILGLTSKEVNFLSIKCFK
jgi:hypothetical protein